MRFPAESKKGLAVHNSWQLFLLLNLLFTFKAVLEGIFFLLELTV